MKTNNSMLSLKNDLSDYGLVCRNVSKTFGSTQVLFDIDFEVKKGEVFALLGSNGAGKSTLVKILSGVYEPDEGTQIFIGGNRISHVKDPIDARTKGFRVVHQEAPLIPSMTLAECVAVTCGYPLAKIGVIQWKQLYKNVQALFDRLKMDLDPYALAGALSAADRALFSLAIALADSTSNGNRVLIIDEITASLQQTDTDLVMSTVKHIAENGESVIMITHKLNEVIEYADRMAILCNGKKTYEGPAKESTVDFIIDEMLRCDDDKEKQQSDSLNTSNEALWKPWNVRSGLKRNRDTVENILEVRNLEGRLLRDISISLRKNEILGIAGLMDSGVREIPRILMGLQQRSAGDVLLCGRPLPIVYSPTKAVRDGISLVPGDRRNEGGVLQYDLRENITLPFAKEYWGKKKTEIEAAKHAIDYFGVVPNDHEKLFSKLSGGNQQKVVVAKWMMTNPEVIIFEDPTVGVDMGARRKIYESIRDAAANGIGIIVVSSDFDEMENICSRVVVVKEGRVNKVLEGGSVDRATIMKLCYSDENSKTDNDKETKYDNAIKA